MKCKQCSIETINPSFCSRSCSASYSNHYRPKRKLTTRYCTICAKKIDRRVHTDSSRLCGTCQKNQNLFDKTLAEYYVLDSIRDKHPSWRHAHIRGLNRSWNKDLIKLPCASCGYLKHVELAHRIAISSFPNDTKLSVVNAKSNVIQLCRNCHWEFDHGYLKI